MPEASTALLTDRYELTMLQAALASGTASRDCVFEVYARSLHGRRYGVVAGTGRLMEALARFRFGTGELDFLSEQEVVDDATLEHLASWRFAGDVDGLPEGEVYLPGTPVLQVRGTFAQAVLLETLVLSVLNADSAVATAAVRMARAAGERPCVEFGGRRTSEEAAVSAARAAWVAGFAATSNLEAGRRWGIPTSGTSAHAFTLLHDDEESAFSAQLASLGTSTTLLVDTYDTEEGLRRAVALAGTGLGAVRLDSGDLAELAARARRVLDEAGATSTRVLVTSDLDEHAIAALAAAPVDGYGVGTSVVTGSGVPTAGLVYKLLARSREPGGPPEPVAKTSEGKTQVGGVHTAWRRSGDDGRALEEVVVTDATSDGLGRPVEVLGTDPADDPSCRALSVPLVRDGEVVADLDLAAARERCRASVDALPEAASRLSAGEPCLPTRWVTPGWGRPG